MFMSDDGELGGVFRRCGVAMAKEDSIRLETRGWMEAVGSREFREMTIVVAHEEEKFVTGREVGDGAEFVLEGRDRDGVVDDIAGENDFEGLIGVAKAGKALRPVIDFLEGQELAVVAMGPGVTEVEVGDGEDGRALQEESSA